MDCDEVLSHISINSNMPSHHICDKDVTSKRSLSPYSDEIANDRNIDINSLHTTDSCHHIQPDHWNEKCETNLFSLVFDSNNKFSATNPLIAPEQGEKYEIAREEFDLDTITQFSYSDLSTNSDCDGFNFGYNYVMEKLIRIYVEMYIIMYVAINILLSDYFGRTHYTYVCM